MLLERYPELHFRILWEGVEEPFSLEEHNALRESQRLHAEDGIDAEMDRFQETLPLSDIEILYVYGLGLGYHFDRLRSWLEENPRRKLVFLEDDIAVIDACERFGREDLFTHGQVFIRFVPDAKAWTMMLKQCAREFPTTRLEFKPLEAYVKDKTKKRIAPLKLKLLRFSGLMHTYFSEAIHAHIVHRNLLQNLEQLQDAFDARGLRGAFEGVPAIICGAGPSLRRHIDGLAELQDRALLFAGGSTITAMGNLGLVPHLALAIDPNKEEVDRFEASVVQEVPFIFGNRIHPEVFKTFNAPLGFLPTNTGGTAEGWLQKKLELGEETIGEELGPEALSVTTLSVALAYAMGCDPICFVGVDLAYTGLKRYAEGVMEQKNIDPETLSIPREQLDVMLKRKDAKGNPIYTLVKWIMEAGVFSQFAKKHRKRKFFRIGEEGLPIKGIPVSTLEDVAQHAKQQDLLGKLHQVVQTATFQGITKERLQGIKNDLRLSLERIENICQDMLKEIERVKQLKELPVFPTGQMIARQLAFEEELAYPCLFESVGFAFTERNRLERNLPALTVELEFDKWRHYLAACQYYLKECL